MERRSLLIGLPLLPLAACNLLRKGSGYRPIPEESVDARLGRRLEEFHLARLDRSPELRSRQGDQRAADRWDPAFDDWLTAERDALRRVSDELRRGPGADEFSSAARISRSYLLHESKEMGRLYPWRYHDLPLHPWHGPHIDLVEILLDHHPLDAEHDVADYVARLEGLPAKLSALREEMELRSRRGLFAPTSLREGVIAQCRQLLRGAPFEDVAHENILLAGLRKGARKLTFEGISRESWMLRATRTLAEGFGPAMRELLHTLAQLEGRQLESPGAVGLPEGRSYYGARLLALTGQTSQETLLARGEQRVGELHEELCQLAAKQGIEGNALDVLAYLRAEQHADPLAHEEGLVRLRETQVIARRDLARAFPNLPNTQLVIEALEPERSGLAAPISYLPGIAGKQAARLRIDVHAFPATPAYQLEALAFEEGIPGRHMLRSSMLEGVLPRLQRYGTPAGYGTRAAFEEGWCLYAARVASELGAYRTALGELGRVSRELWHAASLVIDAGLHEEGWSREAARTYIEKNTPEDKLVCDQRVERLLAEPALGSVAIFGMDHLLKKRQVARSKLGARFDERAWHASLLATGTLPLNLSNIARQAWIAAQDASDS